MVNSNSFIQKSKYFCNARLSQEEAKSKVKPLQKECLSTSTHEMIQIEQGLHRSLSALVGPAEGDRHLLHHWVIPFCPPLLGNLWLLPDSQYGKAFLRWRKSDFC